MRQLAFIYGGPSVEHEISILTALQAMSACDVKRNHVIPVYVAQDGRWWTGDALFDRSFYRRPNWSLVEEVMLEAKPGVSGLSRRQGAQIRVDVIFPCFHGHLGEDGAMQGLFELCDIPYTGCNVTASALCMDKFQCKQVLRGNGIPVLEERLLERQDARADIHRCLDYAMELAFPLFVKPAHLGSSVGIARADTRQELLEGLAQAFRYDQQVLVEPCVQNLMEINVAILEGDPPIASVVEVPVASETVLTYSDKYLRGGKSKGGGGMASLVRAVDPADLNPDLKASVLNYAVQAFCALGCQGVVRFDFLCDSQSGALYLNEPNPLPGSLAYYLWDHSEPRLLLTEVIERMIDGAILRKASQAAVQRDMGFAALN